MLLYVVIFVFTCTVDQLQGVYRMP